MDVLFLFQNSSWKSFVSCLVWKNKEQFICESIDKNVISNAFEAPLLELLKMMSLLLINDQANTNKTDHIAFKLNVDLLHNKPLSSEIVKVSYPDEESFFDDLKTANSRRVKYLLYLYAHIYGDFSNPIDVSKLQIEHILPKEWQNACFDGWDENSHAEYLEKIGNKILLDSKRNIKCANNFFAKKKEIYKESSDNLNLKEVKDLAAKEEKNAWYKEDIDKRGEEIYKGLKNFVMSQNPA
ncbi:HNH endonuclease family protein [Helicobacter sp.]|uniref:HNH endonuclease family protein n=1 Tax=Helicobacter sp. TaxID=218 RepID=UPI0025BFDDFE|nr:HNH endonuclease family protein [Helicobacter sp.]